MIELPSDAMPRRDHTTIGTVVRPDFVRLPAVTTMFAARAQRFATLATPDQPLALYLRFLSHLADVQHRTQAALPAVSPLRRQEILSGGLSDRIACSSATPRWTMCQQPRSDCDRSQDQIA